MKRISNENGTDAGLRNVGRLALSGIPFALGAGACIWLGFWISAHGFFNQLNQEDRRAVYVGAAEAPKGKLKIETPNEGCVKITRVDLDGSTAAVYFTSKCQRQTGPLYVNWQLLSPNKTLLESGWAFSSRIGGPDKLGPGESGEAVFSGYFDGIKLDKRAESIRFWVE